jgi:hypothetical protein
MEASFLDGDGIIAIAEDVLCAAFHAAGVVVESPFPRMTYDEAMLRCVQLQPACDYLSGMCTSLKEHTRAQLERSVCGFFSNDVWIDAAGTDQTSQTHDLAWSWRMSALLLPRQGSRSLLMRSQAAVWLRQYAYL